MMRLAALAVLAIGITLGTPATAEVFHTQLPCDAFRTAAAPKADRLLVICSGGSAAHLVELPSGKVLGTFTQSGLSHGFVNGYAISDDGTHFALSFLDSTLFVGSDKVAAPLAELKTDFYLNYLQFSPDGKSLYADNRLIEIAPSLRIARTIPTEFDAVNAVALSPDGRTVLALDADTSITSYSMPDWKQRASNHDLMVEPFSAAYSTDGRSLVVGVADGRMMILDSSSLVLQRSVAGPPETQITGLSPITQTSMLVTYYPWMGGGQSSYGVLDLKTSTFSPLAAKITVSTAAVRHGRIWLYAVHGSDLEARTWQPSS